MRYCPLVKAVVKSGDVPTVDEFDEWLPGCVGMAKGKFTTDELLRETRGDETDLATGVGQQTVD